MKPSLTKPEMEHIVNFIDELEAVIEGDDDSLIPLYLIERKDIIKQFIEEKLNE
jgi:hypothetical protein